MTGKQRDGSDHPRRSRGGRNRSRSRSKPRPAPRTLRVASYALIVRDGRILLSRLASRISQEPLWNLPGGGVEHGEDPRVAVLREIREETGLVAEVGERPRVYSTHQPDVIRQGRPADYHALRIVFDGWVPPDAPEPRVVEVDGSTVESAWVDLDDIRSGAIRVTAIVDEALSDHAPLQRQRLAAYAFIERADEVLLTRISPLGHHAGSWTLPGGGVDHGERPATALAREVAEECGVKAQVGDLLGVHDVHFTGVAPSGRIEDFHGVHLIFSATLADDANLRVVEVDGTTDAVEWVPVAEIEAERVPVLEVVRHALMLRAGA